MTLYSASKYALGSLTEGLRMELRGDGVTTMLVCPGYVTTGFQQHVLAGQRARRGGARAGASPSPPAECARAIRARRGARRAHRDGAAGRLAAGGGWRACSRRLVEARMAANERHDA